MIVVFFSISMSACATVFSGTKQMLSVQSEPPGAKVYIDNEYKGETPTSFEIKRKLDSYHLTLKKAGRPNYQATLEAQLNPVAVINMFDALGWLIDATSGALMKYDSSVSYTLEDPVAAPQSDPRATAVDPKPSASAPTSRRR
jgi:hypothetical protein